MIISNDKSIGVIPFSPIPLSQSLSIERSKISAVNPQHYETTKPGTPDIGTGLSTTFIPVPVPNHTGTILLYLEQKPDDTQGNTTCPDVQKKDSNICFLQKPNPLSSAASNDDEGLLHGHIV